MGYSPLRDSAIAEWREAARHLNGDAENLIATIEQSFPPAGEIAKRFAFDTRLFQIAAPDSIRLEVAEGMEIHLGKTGRRAIFEFAEIYHDSSAIHFRCPPHRSSASSTVLMQKTTFQQS